ncbi:MAG: RDD family protein [Nitrospiraceae bacterium]|nr:RDD family protein [Nitrospiraceae bacterium]
MQKADLISRAVAAFVDLLIVVALTRLPDIIGFLSAVGYILIRDGLFNRQSIGKKLIGLRVGPADGSVPSPPYRDSIMRNAPLSLAYLLFLIPYAGWVLGPLAAGIEFLAALGDSRGMRIGDLAARTFVAPSETRVRSVLTGDQQDFGAPADSGTPREDD